jgi:(1->4)-alpha-D-glucan 1-alpha-D-glucosylmutase
LAPLLSNWQDGRFKMAVIAALLTFRCDNPDIFTNGGYQPVLAEGEEADEVCAFLRSCGTGSMLVATSRFPTRREKALGPKASLNLPPALSGRRWRNLLSRAEGESLPPRLATAELLQIPAAVLVTL